MDFTEGKLLEGGLMNSPVLLNDKVYRKANKSTETIHQLLKHVREKGIKWVPKPISFDSNTDVLSFINGVVPHDNPDWIWEKNILARIATCMRHWHDATIDFKFKGASWSFCTNTEHQVICHNDFAPYNCVFEDKEFVGLIDFELCAPGSRLWDMSYAAYRYIPIMPSIAVADFDEISPFDIEVMNERIDIFLRCYALNDSSMLYTRRDLLLMIVKRLMAVSQWTKIFAKETNSVDLNRNSLMYQRHSRWVEGLI